MKKYIFIGLLLFCAKISWAQRHEVGIKAGMSNIVGDVGKTNYLQIIPENMDSNLPFGIGVSYKRNFNPYQGVKLSVGYHHLYGYDIDAKEEYRKNRKSYFSNNILEGALTFEYNFFPINNELRESSFSPYIFGGVSGIYYDIPAVLFTVSSNVPGVYTITSQSYASKKRFSWGVPFGLGLKYKLSTNWAIYGEATFRPTFTDDLDFNNIENMEYTTRYQGIPDADLDNASRALDDFINKNYKIGNLNSKDWLNSITIGISYSFGRPPCYCD